MRSIKSIIILSAVFISLVAVSVSYAAPVEHVWEKASGYFLVTDSNVKSQLSKKSSLTGQELINLIGVAELKRMKLGNRNAYILASGRLNETAAEVIKHTTGGGVALWMPPFCNGGCSPCSGHSYFCQGLYGCGGCPSSKNKLSGKGSTGTCSPQ